MGCFSTSLPTFLLQQSLQTGLSSIVLGPVSGDSMIILFPHFEHFSCAGRFWRSFLILSCVFFFNLSILLLWKLTNLLHLVNQKTKRKTLDGNKKETVDFVSIMNFGIFELLTLFLLRNQLLLLWLFF